MDQHEIEYTHWKGKQVVDGHMLDCSVSFSEERKFTHAGGDEEGYPEQSDATITVGPQVWEEIYFRHREWTEESLVECIPVWEAVPQYSFNIACAECARALAQRFL
jgi:hypothetical protein